MSSFRLFMWLTLVDLGARRIGGREDDCLGWGGFNCDFLGGLHGGRAGGTESEIASCSATVSHLRGYTVLGANTPSASRISQTTST
jgi:hypothetical protein